MVDGDESAQERSEGDEQGGGGEDEGVRAENGIAYDDGGHPPMHDEIAARERVARTNGGERRTGCLLPEEPPLLHAAYAMQAFIYKFIYM